MTSHSVMIITKGGTTQILAPSDKGVLALVAFKSVQDGKEIMGHNGLTALYNLHADRTKTSRYQLGATPSKSRIFMVSASELAAAFEKAGIPAPMVVPPQSVMTKIRSLGSKLRSRQPAPVSAHR